MSPAGLVTLTASCAWAAMLSACPQAVQRPSEMGCEYERVEGTCEVVTTLNPREPEAMNETASLVVRWEWTGKGVSGEVPDRVTNYEMSWGEAASRADTMSDKDSSRCVVEVGTAPERCLAYRAIIFVEAEP